VLARGEGARVVVGEGQLWGRGNTMEAASRVADWQQRKATHALDPMLAQQQHLQMVPAGGGRVRRSAAGGAAAATGGGGGGGGGGGATIVAKLGRVVLARSSRVQYANQRAYFPVEDCVSARFLPSNKRWR